MAGAFVAQYRSPCPLCGLDIRPGDDATFAAFDEAVHLKCPTDATTLVRQVCPQCFCELPVTGVCGCRE